MNEEQRASQLSAMFDGELSPGECEFVARRLTRDPELRAQWARFAVIGAAMRRDRVQLDLRVAERVRLAISAEAALDDAAALPAHAPSGSRAKRWLRPLSGIAVAAAVAGIAVIGLRSREAVAPGPVPAALVASTAAPATTVVPGPAASGEPGSYVVPVSSEPVNFLPPAQLANYVVAHSEVSMPLSRRNLLTALIATEREAGAPANLPNAIPADNAR